MMKTTATIDLATGAVVSVQDSDPTPQPGFATMDCTGQTPVPQAGWVLHGGQLMTAAARDNLPVLAEIAKLEADLLKPRTQIEIAVGQKTYALAQLDKIAALRAKLK